MNAGTTPDEFFKYFCTDERALEYYDQLKETIQLSEQTDRDLEIAEEQVYFAQTLIDQILESEEMSKKSLKVVKSIIENSQFEM